jgi:hypothetical protein
MRCFFGNLSVIALEVGGKRTSPLPH